MRMKGNKYCGEMNKCGTPVTFRVAGKLQGGLMAPRWFQGTWLGKLPTSEEHIVANAANGLVYRCRSVQPQPHAVRMQDLDSVKGHTWAPMGVNDAVVREDPAPVRDLQLREEGLSDTLPIQPRCVYINGDPRKVRVQ